MRLWRSTPTRGVFEHTHNIACPLWTVTEDGGTSCQILSHSINYHIMNCLYFTKSIYKKSRPKAYPPPSYKCFLHWEIFCFFVCFQGVRNGFHAGLLRPKYPQTYSMIFLIADPQKIEVAPNDFDKF